MSDNAGLKGAAQIAAQQVASTKNVRIKPDIVERLRGYLTRETALEAANEIERLRELDQMQRDEIEAMRADTKAIASLLMELKGQQP